MYDFRKVFLRQKKNFNYFNHDLTFFSSSGSPASRMTSGMMTTDYCCLTCGLPIMENTTSTTTCVKCAKLRTRRRNFAQPWTPGTPPGNYLNNKAKLLLLNPIHLFAREVLLVKKLEIKETKTT